MTDWTTTASVALLAAMAFSGCLDEAVEDAPEHAQEDAAGPSFYPPDHRGDDTAYGLPVGFGPATRHDLGAASVLGNGQGIWLHEDVLYWTNGADVVLVDVSDPAAPQRLGQLESVSARDIDFLDWNGTAFAVAAQGGPQMHIIDVSDPAAPDLVVTYDTTVGVHNLAAVPGTPYIYVSGASGDRIIEVVDISSPGAPVSHTFPIPNTLSGLELNSDGCHDITVRMDLGRAYCAGGGGQYLTGGGETFIWDISEDPKDPVWISALDDPRVIYNHQAFVDEDGTTLIVDDEFLAPNCVSIDLPGLDGTQDPKIPFGAAWVWDISDESDPVLQGIVQNDAVLRFVTDLDPQLLPQAANCGSHFGDIVPGQPAFVMGWYGGGTILVDFADPANPVIRDAVEAEGSTWDARVHRGMVFHSSGSLLVTPLEMDV